ncbi:MAG: DUF6079 family protein [Bacillota bacterium]
MKVKDLIQVPPVRTVIRLADLHNSELRRHMVETFILTSEVTFTLNNIFKKIAASRGEGFFVIGNYGSGKSHLLNILSLILSDEEARQKFSKTCRENQTADGNLPELANQAASKTPLVVEISLVEHSNREYLEEIILKQVAAKLQGDHSAKSPEPSGSPGSEKDTEELPAELLEMPRQKAFEKLNLLLKQKGYGGLLLLVDELSEFLRSKENPRTYNEDIRFLQYLGEFAEAVPAWIIATMQENIENTGSLSGELLHKIKDRYPVRFQLSGEHVKEIVSGRLVQKTGQADQALPQILEELQNAFAALPFSREDFFELYPVHPATVDLLDELRPLFSQHRGVIDFIHYRLVGDDRRDIPPFLDQPAANLLSPDYIFDHFRERIRETVETNPYSDQVFHYYEREAKNIFSDSADIEIALRLLKLLIIGALARAPKRFTTEELAQLLLYRYSGLESSINYDYIEEIMEKLYAHGAYISLKETEKGAPTYSIDLKADVTLLMQKKLANITAALTPADQRIIDGLLPWLDEAYLPLNKLQKEPFKDEEITWQNTKRTGKVIFKSPADLSRDALEDLREELQYKETDFAFFLVQPFFSGQENGKAFNWQSFLKECDAELRRCLALWVPREITAAEEEQLRNAYAYILLKEEYAADNSPAGRQISKQVETRLGEEMRKVKEIFRNLYFQGHLRAGEHMPSPASYGYMPLKELTAQVASEILKARYPRHSEIRPLSEQITGSLIQRTLDLLFSPYLEEESLERGTKMMIESYLAPLGLVKKKNQNYQLEINPKTSPLIGEFLNRIPEEGQVSLERLYRHLRKGPFGLNATCFQVLGTAAILSGAVTAYQGGKRLGPSQVNYYRFWNIEAIGPGSLIRPELQKVLAEIPFLPAKLRSGPLTFTAQQQAWEAVISFKTEWSQKTAEINKRIEQLKDYPFFASVNWENLGKAVSRFNTFLEEIKTSYASREGLERFLVACQSSPLIIDDWQRLTALEQFFNNDLPEILRLGHYLKDHSLKIPEGDNYKELRRRYQVLIDLLEEEALLWEEKYRERLKREFKQFQAEYISIYLSEHNREVGPERIKPYRAILETEAYRLLQQLGRINAVVVKNDLVSVNRLLAQPLERECQAANELLLTERPACSCGFLLGEKIELPEKNNMEKQVLEGLREYISALQGAEEKQKINAHSEHLELIGRRREAEPLQEILKIDAAASGNELVKKLKPLVTQNTVAQINRALTGDAIIAERSIENLQDMLSERVFNTEQLKELFQRWLEGDETKPPEYIRVTRQDQPDRLSREGASDTAVKAEQETRSFLEDRFPRLLGPAGELGLENLFALALLWSWLKIYCPMAEISGPEKGDPPAIFEELISEQPDNFVQVWQNYREDLTALGESLLAEQENLPEGFLEEAAEKATAIASADQLLDSYYRLSNADLNRFEPLLELLVDEPFFPAVIRKAAEKLAVLISAEESAPQLNIITGMLREVLKPAAEKRSGLTASHRKGKYNYLETLYTLAETNRILRETEKISQSPPHSDKHWERFYAMLAPFELYLSKLETSHNRELISEVTVKRWRRHYASLLEPLNNSFAAYYKQESSSSRHILRSLFNRLPSWAAKEGKNRGIYLVILDGARLDFWKSILDCALSEHDFAILREGLLWALSPTITETQLQPLKEEGLLGHVLNMDEQLVAELVSDPEGFLEAVDNKKVIENQDNPVKAVKYNYVDEKIHASKDALPVLLEELLMQSRKKLVPFLEYLAAGDLLLLVSDHGFKTNFYHDKSDKEDPLYLHGGETFFEVLAPWAMLKKK